MGFYIGFFGFYIGVFGFYIGFLGLKGFRQDLEFRVQALLPAWGLGVWFSGLGAEGRRSFRFCGA